MIIERGCLILSFVETVVSANHKMCWGLFGAILADVDKFSQLKMSRLFTLKFNDQFSEETIVRLAADSNSSFHFMHQSFITDSFDEKDTFKFSFVQTVQHLNKGVS